jgi:hypothetical protein
LLFNPKKGVNHLRSVNGFSERKLERKNQNLKFKDKKTKKESATFLIAGVMAGLYDVFPIFNQVSDFIKAEESFTGKDIWEYASKEEKELLMVRAKELKSFLEKIEKKAK